MYRSGGILPPYGATRRQDGTATLDGWLSHICRSPCIIDVLQRFETDDTAGPRATTAPAETTEAAESRRWSMAGTRAEQVAGLASVPEYPEAPVLPLALLVSVQSRGSWAIVSKMASTTFLQPLRSWHRQVAHRCQRHRQARWSFRSAFVVGRCDPVDCGRTLPLSVEPYQTLDRALRTLGEFLRKAECSMAWIWFPKQV